MKDNDFDRIANSIHTDDPVAWWRRMGRQVRAETLEEAARVCEAEKTRASLCIGQRAGAAMAADTAASLAAEIRSLPGD